MTMRPILWSFRRCPYAMRARLALLAARQRVTLREILLRDKPQAFLDASPTGTVPCLQLPDHWPDHCIDESLDIMQWALGQSDPDALLQMPAEGWDWIARSDGPFKHALDRTKYATRYPDSDPRRHRADAHDFLEDLDQRISGGDTRYLLDRRSIADLAIAPFVRQFAFIDKLLFDAQPWPHLHGWLARFLGSADFAAVMPKFALWQPGDAGHVFPPEGDVHDQET